MFEEAKALIELGLPIIPLCPPDHAHMTQNHKDRCHCPGKMPLIKDWGLKTTTTVNDLSSWRQQFGQHNIGMPLGDASGYCGIDVDGEEGVRLLMEMSNGELPATWEFTTGAGSRLLYQIPDGIKTKKFKQAGKGEHEECALLCTGQQTVMPPSIHASGRQYTWIDGHSPFDIPCAIAPKWLVDKIRLEETSPVSLSNFKLPKVTANDFDFAAEFGTDDFEFGEASDEEFEAEFTSDMSFELPSDVPLPGTGRQGRQKAHQVVVTDELLTSPIPEGQRDNTMTAIVGHYCANRDLRRLGKEMVLNICLQHNQKFCQPPLEDRAIMDKVNYFFDIEASKDEAYKDAKADKPKFEASTMAKAVLKWLDSQGTLLRYDQFSQMYYYTRKSEGPWKCNRDIKLINKWIREVITSPHYGDPSWDKISYINETRLAIEEQFTSAFKDVSDFDLGEHSSKLSKYIVVNNGMLDWKTKELVEWNPDYRTTVSFDIDYDPDAECPYFEQYLSEWLPDEDVRKVVQEYLGYCLIPNTSFRKALFLYGKGRNGKSVFLEFVQSIFANVSCSLSYDTLFQRFGPGNLKDKLVNIYDDTTVSFAKDTGIAKNLIAGGKISAEFKGKDHFSFTNVARIIYSAQETPRTADTTLAWYDRWFFVKFPNTFRTSQAVKAEMHANMYAEKAGIFNWMVEGLRRLMAQDGFTRSKSLQLSTQEYRGLNDNVVSFLSTYCKPTTDDILSERISFVQLYEIYYAMMTKEHNRPVKRSTFRQRLSDCGYSLAQGAVGKSRTTFVSGLTINYDSDEFANDDSIIEVRAILTR